MKSFSVILILFAIACVFGQNKPVLVNNLACPKALPIDTTGLIAKFTFSNTILDETQNVTGIVQKYCTFVPDRFNNPNSAIRFNGSTSYLIGNLSGKFSVSKVTLACWVKRTSSGMQNPRIIGITPSTTTNSIHSSSIILSGNGSSSVLWFFTATGSATGSSLATDNTWHFVVITADGSTVKIYNDGVLGATGSGFTLQQFASGFLTIGCSVWNGSTATPNYEDIFGGDIDDVVIFNRAISAAEVQALYTDNGSSGVKDHSQKTFPKVIELSQNYPNPFNPSTTINFDLPERSRVVLSIYNELGQKVAELFNGDKAAGSHTIQWNAGSFVSGVYFYELRTEKFASVKKLLLIK